MRRNIVHQKNGYLLSELLKDYQNICDEDDSEPLISETRSLKRRLLTEFPEELGFYPTGRQVIVHATDMNPCEFSAATLRGKIRSD